MEDWTLANQNAAWEKIQNPASIWYNLCFVRIVFAFQVIVFNLMIFLGAYFFEKSESV